jgi:heterodisulfide reductase subunit A2
MEHKIGKALVIGAGIGGIRSALDLAETGIQVTLIERAAHIGGLLAQLDYQFPSNHCGMCRMLPLLNRDAGSQFCLRKGLFHDNIEILTGTEVSALTGEAGHFTARLRRMPTWVDPQLCVGCGLCTAVCPVSIADPFNQGLSHCKAIHLPVPHAIPNPYIIDHTACTRCGACVEVCPTQAIELGADRRADFRILVVDDEPAVRDSLREWLLNEGFPTVEMAESGQRALELLAVAPCQLMLTDIKMPGMDGVELLEKARDLYPELAVLMMTAYATVETAVAALKIGARDYFMKPFDLAAILPLIGRIYAEREAAADREIEINAVIVAGGTDFFHPAQGTNTYGYGHLPHVVTNLELERILSHGGPGGGALLRPADGKPIRKIAWMQCVGSRDLQVGADFCSSICCMISVKEAMLVKERSAGVIETAIFHMDLRTWGKSFQRYRDSAAGEYGVRLERARIHSISPDPESGDPVVRAVGLDGSLNEEAFDLVVLALGQRPARDTLRLAEILGLPLNPWGFYETRPLSPACSPKEGVFLSGTAAGQKDIGEAVLTASAAAAEAGRLIHAAGGSLAEVIESPPPAESVLRDPPRVLAAICDCGGRLGVPLRERLASNLEIDPAVTQVITVNRLCTREGWESFAERVAGANANRVLIGACHPYLFIRKLKELANTAALPAHLLEVVNLGVFGQKPVENITASIPLQNVSAAAGTFELAAGLARLKHADPQPQAGRPVVQRALVVGGGVAGMQAAVTIADMGFDVELIEQAPRLGGNLHWLRQTLDQHSTAPLLESQLRTIEKHPHIQVQTDSTVVSAHGQAGDFQSTVRDNHGSLRKIAHGVVILATGGDEAVTDQYGHGTHAAILTQKALEDQMAQPAFDAKRLHSVVMIQCVGSREEPRNYCSRICCPTSLKQALRLKQDHPEINIYILYREMMSCGFDEHYYTEARKAGVIFIAYDPAAKPDVWAVEASGVLVQVRDPVLGRSVEISADLLVLATGVTPRLPAELAAAYGATCDRDGFFQEAESKWRPVESLKEGVFACGLALAPHSLEGSIAGGQAAAQRALRVLSQRLLPAGHTAALVRESLCAVCGRCIDACAYNARWIDAEENRLCIDPAACQGCGACAAVCPNGAAVVGGQFKAQLLATIDAAAG